MAMKKRRLETRALPVLEERKNTLLDEMNELLMKAEKENRALSEEEDKRFLEIENEIKAIEKTIKAKKTLRELEDTRTIEEKNEEKEAEKRFLDIIRGNYKEERSGIGTAGNGGTLIPSLVSKKIIEKMEEMSVVFAKATKFYVGGDLTFVTDDNDLGMSAAYADDFAELTEKSSNPTSVKLEAHIIGTLAKISRSLLNRTDFDLMNYVVYKVSKVIIDFIEKELITGTTKIMGLVNTTNLVTTAAGDAITADELIDLQLAVPTTVKNKCWVVSRNTLAYIRKLKGTDGQYLCGNMANGFGMAILNEPVFVSDNMPEIGAEQVSVVYGDLSGMYVKFSQDIEVQVLMEKYATQHAIGVVAYAECDGEIVEKSKIAALKGAGA